MVTLQHTLKNISTHLLFWGGVHYLTLSGLVKPIKWRFSGLCYIQPEMDVIRTMVYARISQNLTQKELAERTGINRADISK